MRLIDADALKEKSYNSGEYNSATQKFDLRVVDEVEIDDAPTISACWIKATPDTMPPDLEPVIVTYEEEDGKRDIFLDAVWCEERNGWAFATECGYEFVNMKITHWMPLPNPPKEE